MSVNMIDRNDGLLKPFTQHRSNRLTHRERTRKPRVSRHHNRINRLDSIVSYRLHERNNILTMSTTCYLRNHPTILLMVSHRRCCPQILHPKSVTVRTNDTHRCIITTRFNCQHFLNHFLSENIKLFSLYEFLSHLPPFIL